MEGEPGSELTSSSAWSVLCFRVQKYLQSNEESKRSKNVEIFKIYKYFCPFKIVVILVKFENRQ